MRPLLGFFWNGNVRKISLEESSSFDVSEREIQTWLFKEKEIDAEVKRLSSMLFSIRPLSLEGHSRMLQLGSAPFDPLFQRTNRWSEVLGPNLKPIWVRLVGIPLHAWDAMVFHRSGDCLGVVLETDEEANRKQRVDRVRVLILRDPQLPLPATLAMDVERVPFFISISAEEFQRRLEKTGSLEICHWSSKATRANFSSVDYGRISGDLGFGWDKTKALVMVDNAVEILAQPNDCVGLLPGEHEADKIIEGKMIEIA